MCGNDTFLFWCVRKIIAQQAAQLNTIREGYNQ